MMEKLGFKPGESLGKRDTSSGDSDSAQGPKQVRSEPLNLIFKEDRGGIGLDSEKKRKIREEAEEATKKIKREEGDYRDRVREERELKRTEAQVRAAQKVAERLDAEAEEETAGKNERQEESPDGVIDEEEDDIQNKKKKDKQPKHLKPTSQINLLYRGLVREREEHERAIQARHALQSSLPSSFFPNPRLPGYDDVDLEREDKQALGAKLEPYTAAVEQEVEEEDPELDAFNAQEPAERLRKLVAYLRDTYRYCFWCKYRYETDEELEGCPGLTEEDHD